MRPPYPIAIVPLLPEFLQRRRAKMTFPLRMMDELGLDRPAYFWVINLSYRGAQGALAEPGDLDSVYATIGKRWLPMAAAARGAGLAEERDGRWYLTSKGRDLAQRQRAAEREHYATLAPLPRDELSELARLLDTALRAAATANEPAARSHTPWAVVYRGEDPADGSFAQLDVAVYGLWQVRDDCHMAAWRAAGMTGPDVEVLTRLWRNEASDENALGELLPHQRPADVVAGLSRLRADGRVEPEALRVTPRGATLRRRIEDETDRLFFEPWPDQLGRKADWVARALSEVNAALA